METGTNIVHLVSAFEKSLDEAKVKRGGALGEIRQKVRVVEVCGISKESRGDHAEDGEIGQVQTFPKSAICRCAENRGGSRSGLLAAQSSLRITELASELGTTLRVYRKGRRATALELERVERCGWAD